jgi:hypothetical protein
VQGCLAKTYSRRVWLRRDLRSLRPHLASAFPEEHTTSVRPLARTAASADDVLVGWDADRAGHPGPIRLTLGAFTLVGAGRGAEMAHRFVGSHALTNLSFPIASFGRARLTLCAKSIQTQQLCSAIGFARLDGAELSAKRALASRSAMDEHAAMRTTWGGLAGRHVGCRRRSQELAQVLVWMCYSGCAIRATEQLQTMNPGRGRRLPERPAPSTPVRFPPAPHQGASTRADGIPAQEARMRRQNGEIGPKSHGAPPRATSLLVARRVRIPGAMLFREDGGCIAAQRAAMIGHSQIT